MAINRNPSTELRVYHGESTDTAQGVAEIIVTWPRLYSPRGARLITKIPARIRTELGWPVVWPARDEIRHVLYVYCPDAVRLAVRAEIDRILAEEFSRG